MKKIILGFIGSLLFIFSGNAQPSAFITPNTVEENQAIQVFISGSSQSQFEESTIGAPAQLRLNDGNNIVTVINNYNNWQYNSSVGDSGFYTNLPALSVGTYALEVNNCWATGGCWSTLNANAFTVTAIPGQITSFTPSKVIQGQQDLYVNISGVNTNFENWSWVSLVFSQYSGTSFSPSLYQDPAGNINSANSIDGFISIPIDADTGLYDLTVSSQPQSWLPTESYSLSNALTVYPGMSVDQTILQQGTSGQLFVSIPLSTLQEFIDTTQDIDFILSEGPNDFFLSYSSYQWNGNVGSYGYYVDYNIPYNESIATYSLVISAYSQVWYYSSGIELVIESNMTITPVPPTITSISPNQGSPGQNLSVTISGANMDFGDQYSGISTFRLQDMNGQNIWGTSNSTSGNNLYGDITIPSNASLGSFYHLDVWDYGTSQFIRKDSAFQITLSATYAMMPNTAEQGDEVQVFISGSENNFTAHYCWAVDYWADLRLYNSGDVINIPNNSFNQVIQYGISGFLADISIANITVGDYHLQWNECEGIVTNGSGYPYNNDTVSGCSSCWTTLSSNAFTVTPSPPKITSITPNNGSPGDNLSVAISGFSMDFGNQWSGISTFRLQDANGQDIYGTSQSTVGDTLFGNISIPTTASFGYYNLDVWNYGTSQWVRKDSAFNLVNYGNYINVPLDFTTIQAAINASNNGDTILVEPGTYYENINFNGKNVFLTSNYHISKKFCAELQSYRLCYRYINRISDI